MKSSGKKEEADPKRKYVFFSDPDVIVKRAETSAAAAQARQFFQLHQQPLQEQRTSEILPNASADPQPKPDLKGLETLLAYHPVQPYPFTFITAVKRKLALSMHAEACKKAYEPKRTENVEATLDIGKINAEYKRSIGQAAQKMDFIKPLKVPDLKISAKTLDYSPRENFSPKETNQQKSYVTPKKFETPSKEVTPHKNDKVSKSSEKVQRKLDFSLSEGSPIKSCENIEPLRAPDLSISSGLTKKKEHARDNSREKENRSKRIKKDDNGSSKNDEFMQDVPKRSKTPKHVSRKDDATDSIFKMFKSDSFLNNAPRESDFAFRKPKNRNFVTSTVKKEDDKRHRSVSMRSARSARERSSETRNRIFSNDSISDRTAKLQDRITVRDSFGGKAPENIEEKYKSDDHFLNILRQTEDQKFKNLDNSASKQQKQQSRSTSQSQTKQMETSSKEQIKRTYDKQKPSTSKSEPKNSNSLSEISEDLKTASDVNTSSRNRNVPSKTDNSARTEGSIQTEISSQQSKGKGSSEFEKTSRSTQGASQVEKSRQNLEDSSKIEISSSQNTMSKSRQNTDCTSQTGTVANSIQTNPHTDPRNSISESFSEVVLDPRRISFRDDSYTQQDEFCDLVTPDINLVPRSKRKKQPTQEQDTDMDIRSPKHKPVSNVQTEDTGIQLLHPTALHMQFQAELHLLDSFNESLRQVMDVEKCLYGVKHEQEQELLQKQKHENEEMRKQMIALQTGRDTVDTERYSVQHSTINKANPCEVAIEEADGVETQIIRKVGESHATESHNLLDHGKHTQNIIEESDNISRKHNKPVVKMSEVQTQTVNDIATQTETPRVRRRDHSPGRQMPGITYQRGSPAARDIPQLSLESLDKFEDLDQIENVSLPSRMRTMSEISLHETTSSIRTETGTEISISTRDVTCSFNKYLDLELAQLIKDEKQRYDEIEMLFKSREKTLNDRTKKLVKLEEQKRALRDMGQDSRISSVKKKQRALLLKLQQEKDEMNRLKELHKMASQERKLMLQKQRNMLNPQLSTKNILTKLKRSADSQSPRRLSGPMKGYDIRSPSSMSSLIDSDKSQVDRPQLETRSQILDVRSHKSEGKSSRSDFNASILERHDLPKTDQFEETAGYSDALLAKSNKSDELLGIDAKQQKPYSRNQKSDTKSKYEIKSRKYEEKMPRVDVIRYKSHEFDEKSMKLDSQNYLQKPKSKEVPKLLLEDSDKSISENIKSESDTLVDELSKRSKSSQATEIHFQNAKSPRERESVVSVNVIMDAEDIKTESDSVIEELCSKKSRSSQVTADILQTNSKSSKKNEKTVSTDTEPLKKLQNSPEFKSSSKRKGSRSQKSKSSSDILTENILRSKSSSQIEEIIKHHSKRSKIEKDENQSEDNYQNSLLEELDLNESQSSLQALVKHSKAVKEKNYELMKDIASEREAKENISARNVENCGNGFRREEGDLQNLGNISTRSQVSTLTISRHSSGDSEKSYSRSVVIRAQDHHFRTSKKLEQILSAREAALSSRRNCVEEWIAWHARLRTEESRVARMEQAAFKLVNATPNALSYHDTTVSSDTSDVEGRVELLAEKLSERRVEMARLKKEARRQAKQRLKALEANLLNQIKKYDTTIHEMRKKLETKRGAAILQDVSSEKLAIESKSLADFKVPDIPIRRIQEIYKKNDRLQSSSDSELKSFAADRNQQKTYENTHVSDYTEEYTEANTGSQVSSRSIRGDSTETSENFNLERKTATQSIQSIFEDVKMTASSVPEYIPENIQSKSIAEEIVSEKSGTRSKGKSDSEDIQSNTFISTEIQSDRPISEQTPRTEIDLISARTKISQDSSIASGRSQYDIPENIQIPTRVQSSRSELPQTILESEISDNNYGSIQKSISESVSPRTQSGMEENIQSDSELLEHRGVEVQNISERDSVSEVHKKLSAESPPSAENKMSKSASQAGMFEKCKKERLQLLPLSNSEKEYTSILSKAESLSTDAGRSSIVDEVKTDKSVENSPTLSKKLNFLELGNKNLNEDISTLENDLKALSEMMSRFSRRSDSNLRSEILLKNDVSEKNTCDDVSEVFSKADLNADDNKTESIIAVPSDLILESLLKTNDNVMNVMERIHESSGINEKDLATQVTEIMSKIMPSKRSSLPMVPQEIDFEARSKEILNEIEKSIISEHAKSPEKDDDIPKVSQTKDIQYLENENVAISNDLNSLEDDIKSIAEIISKMTETKKGMNSVEVYASREPTENIQESPSKLKLGTTKVHDLEVNTEITQASEETLQDLKECSEKAATLDDGSIQTEINDPSDKSGKSGNVISDRNFDSLCTGSYTILEAGYCLKPDYYETLSQVAKLPDTVDLKHTPVLTDVSLSKSEASEIIHGLKNILDGKKCDSQIGLKDDDSTHSAGEPVEMSAAKEDSMVQELSLSYIKSLESDYEHGQNENVYITESEREDRKERLEITNGESLLATPQHDKNELVETQEHDQSNLQQTDFEFEQHNQVQEESSSAGHVDETQNGQYNERKETAETAVKELSLDSDWTISDSFEVQQDIREISANQDEHERVGDVTVESDSNAEETGISLPENEIENQSRLYEMQNYKDDNTLPSNMDEISMLAPKYESTQIEAFGTKFDDTVFDSNATLQPRDMFPDELDDILDIIAQESKHEKDLEDVQIEDVLEALPESVVRILDKVENAVGIHFANAQNESNSEIESYKIERVSEKLPQEIEIVEIHSRLEADEVPITKLVTAAQVDSTPVLSIGKVEQATNIEQDQDPKAECAVELDNTSESEAMKDISVPSSDTTDDLPVINISLSVEIDEDVTDIESRHAKKPETVVINELTPDILNNEILPNTKVDVAIEWADDRSGREDSPNDRPARLTSETDNTLENNETKDILVFHREQDSSDGEQLDNLVEVAESGLDMIEKNYDIEENKCEQSDSKQIDIIEQAGSAETDVGDDSEIEEDKGHGAELNNLKQTTKVQSPERKIESEGVNNKQIYESVLEQGEQKSDNLTTIQKTDMVFEIIKDPEYEDISEESLEVSEILDRSESQRSDRLPQKFNKIPTKYEMTQKSDDVLRILDEISQKSSAASQKSGERIQVDVIVHEFEKSSQKSNEQETGQVPQGPDMQAKIIDVVTEEHDRLKEPHIIRESSEQFKESEVVLQKSDQIQEDLSQRIAVASKSEDISQKYEVEMPSESSEGVDTPRGVSEIEMDSPRDLNDSRLDIEVLDDDLLGNTLINQNTELSTEFHVPPIVATSEKDIEAMIDKLKASLEQPGLDVAELEAKLLRIQQLQIELEIKKLEAEEVSYYVREIPNKPPPPYTPPGGGRLPISQTSPSPPPAVVPTNVDDLTSFTEKATNLIYSAKQSGEDVINLEAPLGICELSKDNNETARKDRKIYNTFLFDLCKETISEVYRSECEKPGPSWLKPNVKTKPTVKIPKTVDGLNEYVGKEVATLFGFKTKLQRENLVMRWSRKRRDRVDELLAREAQAEEDEWTKFHHDELAVKNELTTAILDSLILETANVVKTAYANKRKVTV